VAGETSRQIGMTLRDRMDTQDMAVQRRQLVAAHVKYIVLHAPRPGQFQWQAPDSEQEDGNRDAYLRTYPRIWHGPELTILKVY